MNTPDIEITDCPNASCPSHRSEFRGEQLFLEHVVCSIYTGGRVVSRGKVYQCSVCGHYYRLVNGALIPVPMAR